MTQHRQPRKRIEIYFILYLVALVLLLPEPAANLGSGSGDISLSELRLEMQPERVRLLCKLVTDSLGNSRVERVDTMNIVRYSGSVSDVKFSARIEEVETGQVLVVHQGDKSTDMFELIPQPERQAVLFKWRPNVSDIVARTFRVTVSGTAYPVDGSEANSSDASSFPSGLRLSGSAQFVLNTTVEREGRQTYVNTITIVDTSLSGRNRALNNAQSFGEFWIDVAREKITAVATRDWVNRISIGGADPARDLLGMPQVKVTGDVFGEIERVVDEQQRAIILRGKAPRSGKIKVEVTARRKDGQVSIASFVVVSEQLDGASFPDVIFPGIEYVVDPKLPAIENTLAILKLGDKELATVRSGTMKFKPNTRDTNKSLTLERFIDDQRVGISYTSTIKSFPPPEIKDVRSFGGGDKKKVVVKFYGDPNKDRPTLHVVDGNAGSPKKLYGNRREADPQERPTTSWLEEFEVERKDMSRPFQFRIQARDGRGFSSKVWVED